MFLFQIQASEKVMMQGGKLLALVIIMLSALEEQVSGYFFGVFNYLKKQSKRTVTAKLSSRYCSLRITKANAIIHRMGEKRKGHFWSLCYLLEGTHWTLLCGSGVPGILPGVAHTCGDVTDLPSPLRSPGLSKVGGLLVGRPTEPTLHTRSL